jgi:hypothetical protein
VGGTIHRGSGSARRGFRGLGILAGPRRLGRRAIQTPDHSRCRHWLTRRRMSLVGPNWSSFSFVTRLAQPASAPSDMSSAQRGWQPDEMIAKTIARKIGLNWSSNGQLMKTALAAAGFGLA